MDFDTVVTWVYLPKKVVFFFVGSKVPITSNVIQFYQEMCDLLGLARKLSVWRVSTILKKYVVFR